jgi:hypothetical protein
MDQSGGNEEIRYSADASGAQSTPTAAVQQQQPPVGVPPAEVQQAPVAPVSPELTEQPVISSAPSGDEVRWQASEFIDHQKSAGWFLFLAVGAVMGSALMYFITSSVFSAVIVLLAVLAFGMSAKQKPRTLTYVIGTNALQIGDRNYAYDDFRTFSILQEGALYSIFLEPIRRFMPPVSIYFDPNDGEKIFDVLASHIPHAERKPDAIDNFMRRIRF